MRVTHSKDACPHMQENTWAATDRQAPWCAWLMYRSEEAGMSSTGMVVAAVGSGGRGRRLARGGAFGGANGSGGCGAAGACGDVPYPCQSRWSLSLLSPLPTACCPSSSVWRLRHHHMRHQHLTSRQRLDSKVGRDLPWVPHPCCQPPSSGSPAFLRACTRCRCRYLKPCLSSRVQEACTTPSFPGV